LRIDSRRSTKDFLRQGVLRVHRETPARIIAALDHRVWWAEEGGDVDLPEYQRRVMNAAGHLGGSWAIPLRTCELTAAAGAVASTVGRGQDGSLTAQHCRDLLQRELGDLLCRAAALATATGLDLGDVAANSLTVLEDLNGVAEEPNWAALPIFDTGYPDLERFPRQMVVEFRQHLDPRGRHVVTVTLRSAEPAVSLGKHGAPRGCAPAHRCQLGGPLGDPLTDNARQPDGYRFHDAIHLGFLAVLGWSPNMRALLRLKRKSDPTVDECEDGARAIFAEEGLAAVLARLAETRNGFRAYKTVTRDAVEVARAATVGLEVHALPGWLWRRAIWQGFQAMHQLTADGGGQLVADLDARRLAYQPTAAHSCPTAPSQAAA
jgi:MazG-like nucleotide pyrophosphohydrolase family protein